MSARYVDQSARYLRFFVESVLPAVDAMGDAVRDSIREQIQLQDEPSEPGEPIASPPPEHIMWKRWKKSKPKRFDDRVSIIVHNRAKTESGLSLAQIHEHGTDDTEPRPTYGPGIEHAKRIAQRAFRQAVR